MIIVSSPKSRSALVQLGRDVRAARIRRRITAADLAARAGTSPNTIGRPEKGDGGVGIGTLADILVVLGLIARLSDLLDLRHDELGLALTDQQTPQRARCAGRRPCFGRPTPLYTDGSTAVFDLYL